jgi:hypothetical protein
VLLLSGFKSAEILLSRVRVPDRTKEAQCLCFASFVSAVRVLSSTINNEIRSSDFIIHRT